MVTPSKRSAVAIAVAIALTGCGAHDWGSSSLPVTSAAIRKASCFAMPLLRAANPPRALAGIADDSRRSTATAKRRHRLLYVSLPCYDAVVVFAYPRGTVDQVLRGFSLPQGECVDSTGDIFIASTNAASIVEYAHGGTKPIATLVEPGGSPVACAVNPTSGDLAVTNYYPAQVAIYRHARGTPRLYALSNMYAAYFCGYDDAGNLFVDGTKYAIFVLAKLRAKRHHFMVATIANQSIQFPGDIRWDGKYLAIEDQAINAIYQVVMTGTRGKRVGTTYLGDSQDVVSFLFPALASAEPRANVKTVLGADFDSSDVAVWQYPKGGPTIKTIAAKYYPSGVAISP